MAPLLLWIYLNAQFKCRCTWFYGHEITKARETSAIEHERTMESLKRELGRLVVDTTAKVTGKVLTSEDQQRLQEETSRQLA